MKVLGIIQARMGATRLPGKVLLDIEGKPLLLRVVERANQARRLNSVVVATTENPADDKIVKFCKKLNIPVFRGSEQDVLGRFVKAGAKFGSDITVRITADNPFSEAALFDQLIEKHLTEDNEYTFSAGYPLGSSCEVFDAEILEMVGSITANSVYHEHLGTYFLDHLDRFRIGCLKAPEALYFPQIRLTVDTQADLETTRRIFKLLKNNFSLVEIIKLWNEKNELFSNKDIQQFYPTKRIRKAFQGEIPDKII